jgi:hypothetical protein
MRPHSIDLKSSTLGVRMNDGTRAVLDRLDLPLLVIDNNMKEEGESSFMKSKIDPGDRNSLMHGPSTGSHLDVRKERSIHDRCAFSA